MKNVLLLVHKDSGQEARLQAALVLTRALSGHLTCVDVTPSPLVFDGGLSGAPAVIIDESEQEIQNRAEVRQRLQKEDVSWSWSDLREDFIPCLLEVAQASDIIVLNRKLDSASRPNMRAIASSLLVHSDALVVAVDEKSRELELHGPVLIAWDGSDPAFHALQRALPLLKLAAKITIFQAGPAVRGAIPADEAALYLSRHGVNSEIEIGPATGDAVADICVAAARLGARYCVMGAFGHSRIREALLGGVSRTMLNAAPLPLVLAH